MPVIPVISRAKFTAVTAALALAVVVHGVPVRAQGRSATADAVPLEKGTIEVGAVFGTTLPVTWLRAHADRRLTLGALDVGRVMSERRGPGPLAGQFEFLFEVSPLLVVRQPAQTVGFTASPLQMRWNFAPIRRVRPFAEASGGIVFTTAPVPERVPTRLNFIDQAGFGVRLETSAARTWLVGYRFQHISNAGRAEPNPGANFNFFYGGVMFRP